MIHTYYLEYPHKQLLRVVAARLEHLHNILLRVPQLDARLLQCRLDIIVKLLLSSSWNVSVSVCTFVLVKQVLLC